MPDKKFRILCVDDHADTCLMLSTLFGQMGYEVESATDPEVAHARAREVHFDLYVLDGRFQGRERTDICAALSTLDPHARVIFYSGDAQDDARDRAFEAGACGYVAKPDIKGLVAAVKKALAANGDGEQSAN